MTQTISHSRRPGNTCRKARNANRAEHSRYSALRLMTLCLTLLLTSCRTGDSPEANVDAPAGAAASHTLHVAPALLDSGRVAVAQVVRFEYGSASVVPGEVIPAPDGEADIGSLVAGRVASLEAVEGSVVRKGQVLAWIDSPEVGSVRADLVRASAQAGAAQKRLARQLALQSQGATSQSAVDDAQAAVQTAEADRQAANAKLHSVGGGGNASTGRLAIRSPIDGVVIARHATLGGAVAPDATLFHVVNPKRLLVKARWSESLGSAPNVGTSVQLTPRQQRGTNSAPARLCPGKVDNHSGVIDPATRSLTLQIKPEADCPSLTPGSYVDVVLAGSEVAGARSGWVQVPLESVVDLRGLPTVFVATGQPGEFEARPVVPHPAVGGVIPVEHGLEVGERVAIRGMILLKGEALRDILGGE